MDYQESSACSSAHPSEVKITAEIVNQTHQVLDMKVGNSVYFVHMAHLARGATHTVLVDYSDTYQEYKFSPLKSSTRDDSSSNLVVTSDECCDYKRITITEVDGQLTVQREPRVHAGEWNLQNLSISAAAPPPPPPPEAPNRDCRSDVGGCNWRWWIRLRLF